MDKPYSIVLADSHAMFRQGIKKIIEENPELKVIAELGDGLELSDYFNKNAIPDMVILDISMPNMSGIEATAEIKKNYPEIKVLILTIHNDKEYMNRALAVGPMVTYSRMKRAPNSFLPYPPSGTEKITFVLSCGGLSLKTQSFHKILEESHPSIFPNQDVKFSVLWAFRQT